GTFWLMPLYTRVNADDDLGFNADSYGFALGMGGRVAPNLGVEVYAGYLYNDLDFKVRGADSEDQDLYFGGINFIYAPKPYFTKLMALGYYANHNYKGYTGLDYDLVEKADYDSYGLRFDLIGGYIFGEKTRIIPQIGLSYAYYNTDSFWTKVPENPDLRRHYNPDNLDVWKVIGGLDIISDIETKGKMNIRAFGGFRIEQAISDNDISIINYAPNTPKYKLEKSIADTTGVLQGGLIFNYNKRWSFEISGRAELNSDYKTYTGRAIFKINF
ncbi:autotransporter outer membrane beta-barrel domain-containing protein, partial [Caldisericum sp.]|uniref:autotransporter outer membrane beta-barrel domain-containing protein n=1 Tax=Caldisericum sp. TaxID=2499687 RepID=UPI003D1170E3